MEREFSVSADAFLESFSCIDEMMESLTTGRVLNDGEGFGLWSVGVARIAGTEEEGTGEGNGGGGGGVEITERTLRYGAWELSQVGSEVEEKECGGGSLRVWG